MRRCVWRPKCSKSKGPVTDNYDPGKTSQGFGPLCVCVSHSVMPDSLQSRGLQLARLLCPLDFFRQEYWSGLPFPPGDLPHQGSNLGLLYCRWVLYCLNHKGSPLAPFTVHFYGKQCAFSTSLSQPCCLNSLPSRSQLSPQFSVLVLLKLTLINDRRSWPMN